MAYSDLCDMQLEGCPHGLPERHGASASKITELLNAPGSLAHFPGCPHKGDHGDYSRWRKLETPNAWQRLGNGESLEATGGFALTAWPPGGAKAASHMAGRFPRAQRTSLFRGTTPSPH